MLNVVMLSVVAPVLGGSLQMFKLHFETFGDNSKRRSYVL